MRSATTWRRWWLLAGMSAPLAAQGAFPLPDAAATSVRAFQKEHGIPGLSVAVAFAVGPAWEQGFGFADLENDVAASAETVYRLGSISKPVTAVAVLQLVERGALELDVDVRRWVPEFPAKPWPITLRQLLCHQAGIRHYRDGEGESTERYATQRAGLVRFAADELLHEPGTRYFYSTYGYNLAAACVEVASERPFGAAVAAIAARAGAPTLQLDDQRALIRHRAQGYVRRDGELENSALMDSSYKMGGGGLCSSAPDLARFGLALLDDRLLAKASRDAMQQEQPTKDGKPSGYCLGLRALPTADGLLHYHGGAQSRVSTVLLLSHSPPLVVAVMCNLEGIKALPLAQQLLEVARKTAGGR